MIFGDTEPRDVEIGFKRDGEGCDNGAEDAGDAVPKGWVTSVTSLKTGFFGWSDLIPSEEVKTRGTVLREPDVRTSTAGATAARGFAVLWASA